MTKDNNSLEANVRSIVRDELAKVFSGTSRESLAGSQSFDISETSAKSNRMFNGNFGKTKKRGLAKDKGKVKDPSTDRRLKANREITA